ncbi:MAG: universal stress protein [Geminicoccaceae bacterium]
MFKTIVVPIDVNDEHSWAKALPTAVRLATVFDSALHLVAVLPTYGMPSVGVYFADDHMEKLEEAARKALHEIGEKHLNGRSATLHVVHGKIYVEILKLVEETTADLVVMGSHHPELSDYLIGPNAARVVRHAECSVLVVRD